MPTYGFILAVGDSLTYGSRDEYRRDYPFYLSQMLSEHFGQDWVAIAEGKPGETSSELATRIYKVVRSYPECFEVVVLVGTNDAKDDIAHPPAVYKENIEHILRVCRACKKKVYLCTIPDMVGFGAPDYSVRSQQRIKEYNAVLEELAQKYQNVVKLVDLRGIPEEYYADGVHFNSMGYREVARRVMRAILEERQWVRSEPEAEARKAVISLQEEATRR